MKPRFSANRARALGATIALAGAFAAGSARPQDRADLDRTQIIGNRELPKVLYIVPWKKPLQGDLSGRPLGGVLDEALAPVDRDVFRRQPTVPVMRRLSTPSKRLRPTIVPE